MAWLLSALVLAIALAAGASAAASAAPTPSGAPSASAGTDATTSAAAPAPASPASTTGGTAPSASPSPSQSQQTGAAAQLAQARYLAAQLAHDPVYVTDQLPSALPRSSTTAVVVRAVRAVHTSVYTVVLPQDALADPLTLLPQVHQLLDRNGLFVLLTEDGVADARAYGATLPVAEALTAARAATTGAAKGAGPLYAYQVLVRAVAAGPAGAARLAAQASHGGLPAPRYTSRHARAQQQFGTGLALLGLPVLLVGLVMVVRRARHGAPPPVVGSPSSMAAAAAGGTPSPRVQAQARRIQAQARRAQTQAWRAQARAQRALMRMVLPRRARWLHAWDEWRRRGQHFLRRYGLALPAAAVLVTVLMGVAAPDLFSARQDGPSVHPTAADLTSPVDRAAAGLAADRLYVDPETPAVLTDAQVSALEARLTAGTHPAPVYVAVMSGYDPLWADADRLASALDRRLGRPGIYVVADPVTGMIAVDAYDAGVDAYRLSLNLPQDVFPPLPPTFANGADALAVRIGYVLDYAATQHADPYALSDARERLPHPGERNRLAGVFSGDFWPGLVLGPLFALLAVGLLRLLVDAGLVSVAASREARARRGAASGWAGPDRGGWAQAPERLPEHASPAWAPAGASAPAHPSQEWLVRALTLDMDALEVRCAATWPEHIGAHSTPEEMAAAVAAMTPEARTMRAHLIEAGRISGYLQLGDVDPHAHPADLVAALLLVSSARALGAGHPFTECCRVNPLHGGAYGGRLTIRLEAGRVRVPQRVPLCGMCAAVAREHPQVLGRRRLLLPKRPVGSVLDALPFNEPVPWESASHTLMAARLGVPRLLEWSHGAPEHHSR